MLHIDYIAPTHFLLRYESRYVQFITPPAKWTKRHSKSITRKATHFLQPSVQFICTLVRPPGVVVVVVCRCSDVAPYLRDVVPYQ